MTADPTPAPSEPSPVGAAPDEHASLYETAGITAYGGGSEWEAAVYCALNVALIGFGVLLSGRIGVAVLASSQRETST